MLGESLSQKSQGDRKSACRALLALHLLIARVSAGAQTPDPEASEDTSAAGIPAAEIARRAEEANTSLLELRGRLTPVPDIVAIEEESRSLLLSLESLRDDPRLNRIDELTLTGLDAERERWSVQKAQVDAWERLLEQRSEELFREQEQLERIRETWESSRDSSEREEFPEALIDRIESVLDAVDAADDRLRERLNALLTLRDDLSDGAILVSGTLDRLDTARDDARQRLFAPDSVPLWRALFMGHHRALLDETASLWERHVAISLDFLERNEQRVMMHLGVFAAMFLLLSTWQHSPSVVNRELPAHILSRPTATALLVSLLLTPSLYSGLPHFAYGLASLGAVVPVLRILPRELVTGWRALLYGLAGLFVLDQLYGLAPEQTFLQRAVLLGLTVLALGALSWILRPEGLRSQVPVGWVAPVSIAMLRLAWIVLFASLAANVIGVVSLAHLLTTATLSSAYLAVVFAAGALVLSGLLEALLSTRVATFLYVVEVHGDLLKRWGSNASRVLAFLLWAGATLRQFRIWEPIAATTMDLLGKTLALGSLSLSLGDVLVFPFLLASAVLAAHLGRLFLEKDVLPRVELPRGVPAAMSTIAYYGMLLLGFLLALGAAGIDLTRFALFAGAFGVGIGFGLQGLVNNFVSGLILLFERPLQVGDRIELGTLRGVVDRIGLRSSTVRTFDGAEVIVPNGILVSSEVVNWTLSDRLRRLEVRVGVAIGTAPNVMIELLHGVARVHADVLDSPPPSALFRGSGENSLDFTLRFWTTKVEHYRIVRSEVGLAVHQALDDAGIEIPFPQRDVHVRMDGPVAARGALERVKPAAGDGESGLERGWTMPLKAELPSALPLLGPRVHSNSRKLRKPPHLFGLWRRQPISRMEAVPCD